MFQSLKFLFFSSFFPLKQKYFYAKRKIKKKIPNTNCFFSYYAKQHAAYDIKQVKIFMLTMRNNKKNVKLEKLYR